jgi:hypothetical protein
MGVLTPPGLMELTRMPLGCKFERCRPGEGEDSCFRRRVGTVAFGAPVCCRRRDVDNRAAAAAGDRWCGGLDAEQDGRRVHPLEQIPLVDGQVEQTGDADGGGLRHPRSCSWHREIHARRQARGGGRRRGGQRPSLGPADQVARERLSLRGRIMSAISIPAVPAPWTTRWSRIRLPAARTPRTRRPAQPPPCPACCR